MSSVTTSDGSSSRVAQLAQAVNSDAFYLCNYAVRPAAVDPTISYATWSLGYRRALRKGEGWDAVKGSNILKHPELYVLEVG